jgi:hypothetical protein
MSCFHHVKSRGRWNPRPSCGQACHANIIHMHHHPAENNHKPHNQKYHPRLEQHGFLNLRGRLTKKAQPPLSSGPPSVRIMKPPRSGPVGACGLETGLHAGREISRSSSSATAADAAADADEDADSCGPHENEATATATGEIH